MEADPKRVATWLLLIIVPFVAGAFLFGFLLVTPIDTWLEIIRLHFAATVGLPMGALLSAFLVVSLRHSAGPVKFEGLGFKFEGSSGEVVLWICCFLSIALGIKLVW